jgi:hypothetical protein
MSREKPTRVVCTSEGVYSGALTRGALYDVAAVDDAKRQLRVKNDQRRLRWYPRGYFGPEGQPVHRMAEFTIDDVIEHPEAD